MCVLRKATQKCFAGRCRLLVRTVAAPQEAATSRQARYLGTLNGSGLVPFEERRGLSRCPEASCHGLFRQSDCFVTAWCVGFPRIAKVSGMLDVISAEF